MKQLKQTNRTMLFAKISDAPSLANILQKTEEGDKAVSEELLKEVEDKLVVSSFEEFLEKFQPTIYSQSVNGEVRYSLTKDKAGNWKSTPINQSNDFVRLLLNIIDGKAGTTNIEFEYEDEFKRLLGADATAKKITTEIEDLKYLKEDYEKAKEGSPEQRDAKKRLMKEYQKCVQNYSNPISLLPWYQNMVAEAIEDKKHGSSYEESVGHQINLQIEDKLIVEENGIPKLVRGECASTGQGMDVVIEDMSDVQETENGSFGYQAMLMEVYDKGVEKGKIVPVDSQKQMLGAVFGSKDSVTAIKNQLRVMPKEDLTDLYNQYSRQIDTQYENFAKVAKQLIEEIVGIRMFFEQSQIKKNNMAPKLLITNCEIETILNKQEKALRQFLAKTNKTESDYQNAIWFAIIPNMNLKDDDDEDDWMAEDDVENENRNVNSPSVIKKIVSILGEYHIQSFIGFENSGENTFAKMQQKGIQKYQDATKRFIDDDSVNKYMIPCIPNFTVIPENKSRLKSQGKYELTVAEAVNDKDLWEYREQEELKLGGFYVNAAYLAAGIICACQSPDYLKSKKIPIIPDIAIPGVRFDIEQYFDKIDVKMGVEVGGYTEEVKDEINEEQFGFVFTSEGGVNTHVMKARSLKRTEEGKFEPLFVTTTYTYIERLYRTNYLNNMTRDTMEQFFGEVGKKTFWNKYLEYGNGLLQKDDTLDYEVDGNTSATLDLKLKGVEQQLELDINH